MCRDDRSKDSAPGLLSHEQLNERSVLNDMQHPRSSIVQGKVASRLRPRIQPLASLRAAFDTDKPLCKSCLKSAGSDVQALAARY